MLTLTCSWLTWFLKLLNIRRNNAVFGSILKGLYYPALFMIFWLVYNDFNRPKGFWWVLETTFPWRNGWTEWSLFPLFPFLHLFYCISFLLASSFYCISFISASSFAPFFPLKEAGKPDRSGPFSFVAVSNIWCRGIWLPIGGFKDRIYSA